MKQIFMTGRGEIVVETVPEPTGPLGPGFVRVAVAHSLISTGTDRALFKPLGDEAQHFDVRDSIIYP